MKMWHALADTIIDRHECTLRSQARLHSDCQQSRVLREPFQKRGGDFVQRFYVFLGYQERVAGKQGPVIQESER